MNKKYLLAIAASTLMFVACGDEVTEIHQDGMAVLEKGEKLSKQACDEANVGEMLFVMDSSEAFICNGESWQTLKGEKGEDGSDGTSCTAKSVKNKAGLEGLEVTCGGAVVDTIWNGAKGDKGSKGDSGEDGAGCEIVKDSAGVVTLACGEDETADTTTLFKATCGSIAFDPATHYCSEGVVQKYGYITDDRDGQIYKTVKIGSQTWMAENLNYDPNYLPKGAKDNVILSWCYNDSAEYCEKYGRLYTWAAAMDSVAAFSNGGKGCGYDAECEPSGTVRGICPEGWHLPSDDEWEKLFDAVSGKDVAGKMLKFANGWKDYEGSNGNGSDSFGFSALPAGYRGNGGDFDDAGVYALFWSASEYNSNNAYYMYLYYNIENAYMFNNHKNYGFSVRCLQNN